MTAVPKSKEIFLDALALPERERDLFLDSACTDPALRAQVEGLLKAYSRAGQFLEPAARKGPGGTDMYRQTPGGPTRTVGRYHILERLGEGGFGVVYRAEQFEPVKRYAALKIVKLGMDTHEVLKRFEIERQALALMEHPGIARVYDGGITDGGRPYFVMELVIGEPITDYCDQRRMSIRERLGLFLDVCKAVQHAHQKGVIHRDLKPSNVLVTTRDKEPTVKIIDFGIAKAVSTPITDATMHTARGQFVGTPQYMSPEQTTLGGQNVDTRSDVYALGALLFELLSGSTPIPLEVMRSKDLAEVLAMVREGVTETLPARFRSYPESRRKAVAEARGTEAARFDDAIRNELDWIVSKAIERDPERRYATADALAADIDRFLADQPVLTGPPSRTYRARKFVRRNQTAVIAVAAGLAMVVFAIGVLAGAIWHARQSQQSLEAELTRARQRIVELEAAERGGGKANLPQTGD